jgi:dTDP-4-amino-4,6-dideoxygalactose transaminase
VVRDVVQSPLTVPFVDLSPMNAAVGQAVLEGFEQTIRSGDFTNGSEVGEFEAAFADYCGSRHCVGVASGLDGLRLALLSAGIEPGDEVILPALTFAATAEAVVQAGGTPVLVDVSESDYTIDPDAATSAVTPATRWLLPVHLFGQLADLEALLATAERHALCILEDACQAHGATRAGRRAGATGHAGAFSFYPTKNLGAFGDAGAVVTDEEEHARRIRALREHGQVRKYEHELAGYTSRLDTLQAIVLLHKLPLLERWNEERRAIARKYDEALADVGDLWLPPVPHDSEPVWHLYVVRTAAPDELAAFLAERGVATGRHYPQPIHLAPAFAELGYPEGSFPVAEAIARECLSLPVFPGMSEGQIGSVVAGVDAYFHDG